MSDNAPNLQELVAEVAAAYFSNSHVTVSDIPSVIDQIAKSLGGIGGGAAGEETGPMRSAAEEPQLRKLTPAQIRKSVTPEAIVSFEDGKPYKTLKRHLSTHGLTPAEYVAKWGLPADYPMTSANYSAARSQMARSLGLGQKGRLARTAPAARTRRAAAKT